MEKKDFKLVIGLGNPGKRYEGTYHNIGEEALRKIAGDGDFKKPFSVWGNKPFKYLKTIGRIYIKPTVYMNESGKSVSSAAKHFGVKPENILVIHDDSDIKTGAYKLSCGGGSAGHNGIKSIIQHLGAKNFWRLRIGIRGARAEKAGDFVLKKILLEDKIIIDEVLSEIQTAYSE